MAPSTRWTTCSAWNPRTRHLPTRRATQMPSLLPAPPSPGGSVLAPPLRRRRGRRRRRLASVVLAPKRRVRRTCLAPLRGVHPRPDPRPRLPRRLRPLRHRQRQRRRPLSPPRRGGRRPRPRLAVDPPVHGVPRRLRPRPLRRLQPRPRHCRRRSRGPPGFVSFPLRVRPHRRRRRPHRHRLRPEHLALRRGLRRHLRRLRRRVRVLPHQHRAGVEQKRVLRAMSADGGVGHRAGVVGGDADAGRGARGEQRGARVGVCGGRDDGSARRGAALLERSVRTAGRRAVKSDRSPGGSQG